MKRMMPLLLLTLPVISHAADWVHAAQTQKFDVSIDVQSVREKLGYVQAWFKYSPTVADQNLQVWLERFSCSDETQGSVSFVIYGDQTGQTIATSDSVAYPNMQPVAPESIAESQLKLACGLSTGEKWALDRVEAAHAAVAADDALAAAAAMDRNTKAREKDDADLRAAEIAAGLRGKHP